jgi:hypothetical protein
MIDDVLRPLFGRSNAFTVANTVLHGLVEQNLRETIAKFMRHNLPKIVEAILESVPRAT